MWLSWKEHYEDPGVAARDAAHAVVFLLGCGAAILGIITHDLGLIAAATTLFGLVGIARA